MSKRTDVLVLIILPILAAAVTIYLNTNLLVISVLLFFILPSMYIAFSDPGIFWKSFKFAILFSIPMMLFVDTIAAINGAWIIPVTIFPFKLFGISTVDNYFFALGWALFAVLFYEHFFDKVHHGQKISKQIRNLMYGFAVLCFGLIVIFYRDQNLLKIPYFYFFLGLFFVFAPLMAFLLHYPKYIQRFGILALYFFFTLMLYEISALRTGEWFFSGRYIGYVQILSYRFPLEEFFFWMLIATPSLLAYYEFFADHNKLNSKRF